LFDYNNAFILKKAKEDMNHEIIKVSFKKAKEDVEGVKNELAFALRRIAKIEELLNRQALQAMSSKKKK
jgi:hypothetical protein